MSSEYRPGQCNIGAAEQRKRRTFGWLGFGAAALLVVAVAGIPLPTRVLLFAVVPLFGGLLGILQARKRFCAGFALAGIYQLTDSDGSTAVEDESAKWADRRRAATIVLQAMIGAVVGTLVLYFGATTLLA
ncbi:MAG: hypothetical protein ABEI76_08315 [Halobacteriales archaeon]